MEKAHDLSQETRTLDVSVDEDIKFSDMLLSESTLAGLEAAGFRKPSPIQKKAIPFGRCGFDLIVQAKSGTGKTCVFAVIAMEMILPTVEKLQVVILAPTREISVQISNVISSLTRSTTKPKVESFIGGIPLEEDKKKLFKCQIAVGAPGRMRHLISTGLMDLSSVRLFVLDEADRLMEENFRKDISYIYSKMPSNKQMVATSATFPDELENFVAGLMKKPVKVSPGRDTVLLGIRQFAAIIPSHPAVLVQMKNKTAELVKILSSISFKQCLVFSNYQSRAESICDDLTREGWPAIYINGSQTQIKRLKAFNSLKEYRCRVLLSTDLTSRGIDAENVNLIINLDLPYDAATYLHRIGRAGRYGTLGIAVTILQDGVEVERFRNLLCEIGGENFHVSIFPKEKPNFDVWTVNYDDFDKLSSLSGQYKFIKKEKEFEKEKKSTANVRNSNGEAVAIIHQSRLPRPEKLAIDDIEILTRELNNFKTLHVQNEISKDQDAGMTYVPLSVEPNLINIEKSGWNSFYRRYDLFKNVEIDAKSSYKDNGDIYVDSSDSEVSTNSSQYSTSSLSSSGKDENRCEKHCTGKEFSQMDKNSNVVDNWYAMWCQQSRLIRNYVQYYHYWKEMINFS